MSTTEILLTEILAEVKATRADVNQIKERLTKLENEFYEFREEFYAFKEEMYEFREEFYAFKEEMYEFREEFYAFKEEVYKFREEFYAFKKEVYLLFDQFSKEVADEISQLAILVSNKNQELRNAIHKIIKASENEAIKLLA